jgi:hypothetical protein
MRTTSCILIALAMMIALTCVVMADDTALLCPWGNDNPQGFPITSFGTTSAGHCVGYVILGTQAEAVHNDTPTYSSLAYQTLTLASGEVDYALETNAISQGISTNLNTQKAVVTTGIMSDSESYGYEVVNAPKTEVVQTVPLTAAQLKCEPVPEPQTITVSVPNLVDSACYMGQLGYLSMNSEAAIGTQLSLNTGNAEAPVNANYQFGITGTKEGSLADGMTSLTYGYKTIDYTGTSRFSGSQVWGGKYEFTHTSNMVITP